jgi:hypothetical protein
MDAYEVHEKLGAGSFGTIRKIIRKADRKVLCWKEIRCSLDPEHSAHVAASRSLGHLRRGLQHLD